MDKVLWLVTDNDASGVMARAQAIGAMAVCIRTDNPWLAASIPGFHAAGLRVYGWRFAAINPAAGAAHHFVDAEAQFAVQTLIPAGLDGYIPDPEEAGNPLWNWNYHDAHHPINLVDLANRWCDPIIAAGRQAKPNFLFALTSGCVMPTNCSHLPWNTFVSKADVLLPQIYWYGEHGYKHGNTPQAAFALGMHSWHGIAQNKPVLPIFGEMGKGQRTWQVVANEFNQCAPLLAGNNFPAVHFYSYVHHVDDAVWQAIQHL